MYNSIIILYTGWYSKLSHACFFVCSNPGYFFVPLEDVPWWYTCRLVLFKMNMKTPHFYSYLLIRYFICIYTYIVHINFWWFIIFSNYECAIATFSIKFQIKHLLQIYKVLYSRKVGHLVTFWVSSVAEAQYRGEGTICN